MSIEIKGKVYRNLQEQVEKNKEDIEQLQTGIYTAGSGINITEKVISVDNTVALKSELFSGNYNDLTNKPNLTVTIYQYTLANDIDPNQPVQFSGTITLIGNVVIAVNGVVIIQDVNKYPVVAFDQINEVNNTITITGTGNANTVTIDVGDFDAMNTYPLY